LATISGDWSIGPEQGRGQFYVENLPGAGGTIGAGMAAKAPADGYTVLMINQDFIIQPLIKAKVPYDVFNSFAPIPEVMTMPAKNEPRPSPVTLSWLRLSLWWVRQPRSIIADAIVAVIVASIALGIGHVTGILP
jgi:Tripartite tricarboxylate transporter family receptor